KQEILAGLPIAEMAHGAGEHGNGTRGAAIALEEANRPAAAEHALLGHARHLTELGRSLTRLLMGAGRPEESRDQANLFVFAALAEGSELSRETLSATILSGSGGRAD